MKCHAADEAYRVSKVIDNEFHYEPFEGTEDYRQEMADDLTTKVVGFWYNWKRVSAVCLQKMSY